MGMEAYSKSTADKIKCMDLDTHMNSLYAYL